MAETAEAPATTATDRYTVVPEDCIACDACCQDFPEIFWMGDDNKAHAIEGPQPLELYNARTVVEVCPTGAILFSGELPPPEDLAKMEAVPGWEAEWARWRGIEEDPIERERRYGRDYTIEKQDGIVVVTFQFPRATPLVRDRFRFGLPDEMPNYRHHVQFENKNLLVAGWITDPKVKALCHTSNSFPSQFITTLDFEEDFVGHDSRFDAHGILQIALFTDPVKQRTWKWKSHFITDLCTACSICERVCPTNAITSGEIYYIDPDLCINCSVCGVYCPFDAIEDNRSTTVQRIKNKQIPKAVVHEDNCTGCEFCVFVCPFDAIIMTGLEESEHPLPQTAMIAEVLPKKCVSCKLCEQVCMKDAIEVPRQHQFENIGMSFMSYITDGH